MQIYKFTFPNLFLYIDIYRGLINWKPAIYIKIQKWKVGIILILAS